MALSTHYRTNKNKDIPALEIEREVKSPFSSK